MAIVFVFTDRKWQLICYLIQIDFITALVLQTWSSHGFRSVADDVFLSYFYDDCVRGLAALAGGLREAWVLDPDELISYAHLVAAGWTPQEAPAAYHLDPCVAHIQIHIHYFVAI